MNSNLKITYIIRCHDLGQFRKLKNALSSVAAQDYDAVEAFIAFQDLPEGEISTFLSEAKRSVELRDLKINFKNFHFETPGDYRGALLNLSLELINSRFVAFLDYDDVVYHDHAQMLISDLLSSSNDEVVISFGGCMVVHYDDTPERDIIVTRNYIFNDFPSVSRCVFSNCFPIHSFAIDLSRMNFVPAFGEQDQMFEDYAFLLQVFENYKSSTNLVNHPVCEYRINNDNSNTVVVGGGGAESTERVDAWRLSNTRIERSKKNRFFLIPYEEVRQCNAVYELSRQPFLRGMFVCAIAKRIRKKYGEGEAISFLTNPKGYFSSDRRLRHFYFSRLLF